MENRVYIFGAHSRARTVAYYLKYLNPDTIIEAYFVDNGEYNDLEIEGVPVIKLGDTLLVSLDTSLPVYIGTRGVYFKEISNKLTHLGFKDLRPVTVELDLEIRNKFLKKYLGDKGLNFEKIDASAGTLQDGGEGVNASVYVITSSYDKPLESEYRLEDYEVPLQVGTEASGYRLSSLLNKSVANYDNDGDNTSIKNKQFCEITGLYYLWKNIILKTQDDYIGICHYRRHFLLPDNWRQQIKNRNIDVILPIPLFVVPSVAENYKSRHGVREWDVMMKYLKEMYPDMYDAALNYFSNGLYSPCNMLIAIKEVFNDLCQFMFPILFALADECGTKEDIYQNRYPAFMAERLMSFYFHYNRDKYHIVYADKNFLA